MGVGTDDLVRLQRCTENIRNLCILAHVDHGKTTLSDCLISSNGIISRKLAGKLRYLDYTEDEQVRGITMQSTAISLFYEYTGPKRRGEQFLVNLIDSPGHIDFSSDVSTATRLCDGALLVVDVVEGVCTQTHAVLRQAWKERMRPCLVLNKLDRLITELRQSPMETYEHIQRVIENVNAVVSSMIANELLEADVVDESFQEEMESSWIFTPESGRIIFASAIDGWGFRLQDMARIWSKRLGEGVKAKQLLKMLWGDFSYDPKTKTVTTFQRDHRSNSANSLHQPTFVTMVLEPIFKIYTVLVEHPERGAKMAEKMEVDVPDRELKSKEGRSIVHSILSRWLPLADAVCQMVVDHVPNPREALQKRIEVLWPLQNPKTMDTEDIMEAIKDCRNGEDDPVVIYVSKLFAMKRRDLGVAIRTELNVGDAEDDVLIAFGRIFCGVVTCTSKLYILGSRHRTREQEVSSEASDSTVAQLG